MTVLEATQQSLVLPLILADKLNVGKVWIERLLSSMEYQPETGCWIWQKAKTKGYGMVRIRKMADHLLPVHRLCHELAYGPVPADRHVHHVVEEPTRCMGRACGNPEHTLSVTPREHTLDLTPGSMSGIAAHRDHCARGHLYTEESMRETTEGRRCRICEALWAQRKRDNALLKEGRDKFRWRAEFKKTHCKRGHALTPDNLYWQGKYSSCLTCRHTASSRASTGLQQ